jgi:hypothetical protein
LTEFTDVEMASAFEITSMNSPLIPEDIWAWRSEKSNQSPFIEYMGVKRLTCR